jgi:hypothetical protein
MYRFLRPALAPALILLLAFVWMGCDSDDGVVGVDPDATTVEFASGGGTAVPADSITTLNVRINNPAGSAVTVEVLFAEGASSATPDDIGGLTVDDPISVTFPASASSGDTQSVEIDVSQADITGGAKEARFALQRAQSDSPVRVGNNREFDLSIGFPNIADIRGRIGGTFTFQAIVTSIRGADTSIQDDTGGLVVSRNSDFADAVSVGDQVIITGTITDFDGLRQVDQPDNLASFDVVSSGNPLPAPLPSLTTRMTRTCASGSTTCSSRTAAAHLSAVVVQATSAQRMKMATPLSFGWRVAPSTWASRCPKAHSTSKVCLPRFAAPDSLTPTMRAI